MSKTSETTETTDTSTSKAKAPKLLPNGREPGWGAPGKLTEKQQLEANAKSTARAYKMKHSRHVLIVRAVETSKNKTFVKTKLLPGCRPRLPTREADQLVKMGYARELPKDERRRLGAMCCKG